MIYAKHNVRYQGKMYKPGEALPDGMPDKQWRRLQGIGAIETVHDPVSVVLEEDQEDTGDEDTGENDTGDTPPQTETPAAPPVLDVQEDNQEPGDAAKQAPNVDKPTKKRGGKKAKAQEGSADDLDAIANANTVV